MNETFLAFKSLLEKAFKSKIPLVSLRYRPVNVEVAFDGGDYDFLLGEQFKDEFLYIIYQHFKEKEVPFVIERKKESKTAIRIYDVDTQKQIIIDIWHQLELKDPKNRFIKRILWDDIANFIEKSEDKYRLDIEIEALYFISHLYTKDKNLNKPKNKERLNYYKKKLNESRAKTEIHLLIEHLLEKNLSLKKVAIKANQKLYEMGIVSKNKSLDYMKMRTSNWLHKRRLKIIRKNRLVTFLGPDGVGKTTLIESLEKLIGMKMKPYRFKRLFRKTIFYRIIHPILKKIFENREGQKLQKNQVDDLSGFLNFLIARFKFPYISIRSYINTFVPIDRYFYDYLFKFMRFPERDAEIRPYWKKALKIMPMPRCIIHLDAPYPVLYERKDEISKKDLLFYQDNIFKMYLYKQTPFYAHINTDRDKGECIDFLSFILEIIDIIDN